MVYGGFGRHCRKKHMTCLLVSLQSVIQGITKKSEVWVAGWEIEIIYISLFD